MACLAMYLERLLQYHNHILMNLDKTLSSPHLQEDWDNIFALDVGQILLEVPLKGALTEASNHLASYVPRSCVWSAEIILCSLLDCFKFPQG